jgi:hypothetical protein
MSPYHKGKMRRFVETFFGRGTTSAKHTTNIMSFAKATEKEFERNLTLAEAMTMDISHGLHLRQGKTGKKHLIYHKKGDAAAFVHELVHAAHERKRGTHKPSRHSMELLARLVEFEYMKQYLPEDYAYELSFVETVNEHDPNSVGRNMARVIHRRIKSPKLKLQLIKELTHTDFHSLEEISNWLDSNLAQA